MDHCIKPATTDKIDRSETCLRTHLGPLSRERMRGGGTGAAVRMNLHNFHVEARDWRAPAPHPGRFVMGTFENIPWNL